MTSEFWELILLLEPTGFANRLGAYLYYKATLFLVSSRQLTFIIDILDCSLFDHQRVSVSFQIGLNISEGREHLTGKTMQAFSYVYKHHFNDADWFMKADDDTYVIMENLRYMLSGYDTNEPMYFGHIFKVRV